MEGKGNGIKTVIVNMVDVARALLRPPTYVTKYFGCELGAQTQFDIKVTGFTDYIRAVKYNALLELVIIVPPAK